AFATTATPTLRQGFPSAQSGCTPDHTPFGRSLSTMWPTRSKTLVPRPCGLLVPPGSRIQFLQRLALRGEVTGLLRVLQLPQRGPDIGHRLVHVAVPAVLRRRLLLVGLALLVLRRRCLLLLVITAAVTTGFFLRGSGGRLTGSLTEHLVQCLVEGRGDADPATERHQHPGELRIALGVALLDVHGFHVEESARDRQCQQVAVDDVDALVPEQRTVLGELRVALESVLNLN